jgi:DNA invertase Pin-like site-specific DNA recombinase
MKAIGYFRVEADPVMGFPPSLAEQETAYRRLCQEGDYQTAMTFVEVDSPGETGSAEYQRMLDRIRDEGEKSLVIVKSIAHLNPDPREAVRCLLELEQLGVNVLLTDEDIADPLEATLQVWSARLQGEDRGERVKEAMRIKAIKGRGLGKPPFGYRIGADRKLEIVPAEADTVALMYKLYLEDNMGFRLIARYLNERGMATRNGGRWSVVGIRDILRNRTYIGTYFRFGIRVPESHPAIIPSSIFRRAQEQLSARSRQGGYAPRTPFLLSGLLYCGYCGKRMIGASRRERWIRRKDKGRSEAHYRYYQCQSRTNQSVCQYNTRRTEELEATVRAILERFDSLEVLQRWTELHPRGEERVSERPQLERKLGASERKFRRNLDQAARGLTPLDEMRVRGRQLVNERWILEQRLALVEAEERGELTETGRREYLLGRIKELRERWAATTIPTRKALLSTVFERIVVYDDRVEIMLQV